MTKNLQIAIDKALDALKPHVREVTKTRKVRGVEKKVLVDRIVESPAFVGPFSRKTIELLVEAAIKYNSYLEQTRIDLATLEKRQAECAYTVVCKQCIHPACGSYKDNAILEMETVP